LLKIFSALKDINLPVAIFDKALRDVPKQILSTKSSFAQKFSNNFARSLIDYAV
jgi:hypothetical protein